MKKIALTTIIILGVLTAFSQFTTDKTIDKILQHYFWDQVETLALME